MPNAIAAQVANAAKENAEIDATLRAVFARIVADWPRNAMEVIALNAVIQST